MASPINVARATRTASPGDVRVLLPLDSPEPKIAMVRGKENARPLIVIHRLAKTDNPNKQERSNLPYLRPGAKVFVKDPTFKLNDGVRLVIVKTFVPATRRTQTGTRVYTAPGWKCECEDDPSTTKIYLYNQILRAADPEDVSAYWTDVVRRLSSVVN